MKKRPLLLTAVLFLGIPLILLSSPRRPEKLTPRKKTTTAVSTVKKETPVSAVETPSTPKTTVPPFEDVAIFLVPHPDGEPQKILELLRQHPKLRLTVVFPPHYFDDASRRALIPAFSVLQSSKQIEIALALENQPNLPLLGDLRIAGDDAIKWGISFAWPDDVAAQIARASGRYQKRWSTLPSGFYPPYLSLSELVANTLKKFRLDWVIGRPSDTWGTRFFSGTALLIPPKPPTVDELNLGSNVWAEKTATWSLEQPFVLVDTTQLEDPKADQAYMEALAKKIAKLSPVKSMRLGQEFTAFIQDEWTLPKNFDPFINTYSAWVATTQQKRAWTALADARQVINAYQSSGHANLQRLDAAIEEMCVAESGPFLLELGSNAALAGTVTERPAEERNFLATIGNIYRLCEAPVPSDLNSWFAARTWQKTVAKTAQNDGPFFEESFQSLTWNDPKADDNGAGKYTYPTGNYPKSLFDLRQFTVSWTDSEVTFSAVMGDSITGKPTNIVPMIDVYIDVNRLPDAGSTSALRQRGKTAVLREAAWEYALAFTPAVGVLHQAIPGGNPRRLMIQSATARGNTLSASFSRTVLRGDPKRWRLSIGVVGVENSRRQEEPFPVSILVNATEKNFGGASSGLAAPYIDLLSATTEDQTGRIEINASGGQLTLPFVESQ